MSKKPIPNADQDFLTMATPFARNIAKDPARYLVSQSDADALTEAVERFRVALGKARNGGTSSPASTSAKNLARKDAERIVRRLRNLIRLNDAIELSAKLSLNLVEAKARSRSRACPQEPPYLAFVRALHEGNTASPMHELKFMSIDWKSKPAGAARLELFVDLVPPDEPIPKHPGANLDGRPWYLRSYTRSPIKLTPPMSRVPMMVVYWGRWADATGNVGPWSATVVSRVEGWTAHAIARPSFEAKPILPLLEGVSEAPDADRRATYRIAVIEAQHDSMNPSLDRALPEPRTMRQLEGPEVSEAA